MLKNLNYRQLCNDSRPLEGFALIRGTSLELASPAVHWTKISSFIVLPYNGYKSMIRKFWQPWMDSIWFFCHWCSWRSDQELWLTFSLMKGDNGILKYLSKLGYLLSLTLSFNNHISLTKVFEATDVKIAGIWFLSWYKPSDLDVIMLFQK